MYKSEFFFRVRYAETDQMGFVYYGNYAAYFEVGRVEAFRNLGVSYKGLEQCGIWMPVYDFYQKFVSPAKYDDKLRLETYIKELPKAKIKFEYQLFRGEVLLVEANTQLFFMDKHTKKILRPPLVLLEALNPYF